MTHRRFTSARNLAAFACCLSLLPLLSACGGYYDENGHYTSDDTPYKANNSHPARPGIPSDRGYYSNRADYHDNGGYSYDRRGYYDRDGYYMDRYDSSNVPANMFPPRGMCRVWFTSRPASNQPPVESCNGINSRVPAGAYVIYGG